MPSSLAPACRSRECRKVVFGSTARTYHERRVGLDGRAAFCRAAVDSGTIGVRFMSLR
jgi:hypothetical protein